MRREHPTVERPAKKSCFCSDADINAIFDKYSRDIFVKYSSNEVLSPNKLEAFAASDQPVTWKHVIANSPYCR